MMTRHHQGAVAMAKTELGKGASTEAKALAQKIIDAQQAEITECGACSRRADGTHDNYRFSYYSA